MVRAGYLRIIFFVFTIKNKNFVGLWNLLSVEQWWDQIYDFCVFYKISIFTNLRFVIFFFFFSRVGLSGRGTGRSLEGTFEGTHRSIRTSVTKWVERKSCPQTNGGRIGNVTFGSTRWTGRRISTTGPWTTLSHHCTSALSTTLRASGSSFLRSVWPTGRRKDLKRPIHSVGSRYSLHSVIRQ